MKNGIVCFLIVLFFPFIANSQIWDSLIIKTHPLRDGIAQNPNICFEKILNKKMSIEMEFTYKTQQALALSGEGYLYVSPQQYYSCNGYKILISTKRYFIKSKKIPKAWYLSGQFGYSSIDLPNLTYWHSGYTYKEHRKMELFDFNFLCGKGFIIFRHISSEINFGPGLSYEIDNIQSFDNMGRNGSFYGWGANFYFNWTIGYMITKKIKHNN
jgi:hypothetical protein